MYSGRGWRLPFTPAAAIENFVQERNFCADRVRCWRTNAHRSVSLSSSFFSLFDEIPFYGISNGRVCVESALQPPAHHLMPSVAAAAAASLRRRRNFNAPNDDDNAADKAPTCVRRSRPSPTPLPPPPRREQLFPPSLHFSSSLGFVPTLPSYKRRSDAPPSPLLRTQNHYCRS